MQSKNFHHQCSSHPTLHLHLGPFVHRSHTARGCSNRFRIYSPCYYHKTPVVNLLLAADLSLVQDKLPPTFNVIEGIASGKVKLVGETTEHVIESVLNSRSYARFGDS